MGFRSPGRTQRNRSHQQSQRQEQNRSFTFYALCDHAAKISGRNLIEALRGEVGPEEEILGHKSQQEEIGQDNERSID